MDALKGCTSNVYVLKDIETTRYALYVCQDAASSCARRVSNTITDLREENAMCAAVKDQIWIFNNAEEDVADYRVNGFRLESQGTIAEHDHQSIDSGQPVISTFLDALEGSITFALSRAHNAIKLSAWTWLLPDTETQNYGIEAHMQTQLADDGKKLNISTIVRTSGLISVTRLLSSEISEIVIAPSGMAAISTLGESGSAQCEKVETVTFALGDDQWKASVREALAAEGITVSDDETWLDVVPLGSRKSFYWPMSLCFAQRGSANDDGSSGRCVDDWRSWFDLPDVQPYDDPLSFAEEWTTTFAQRELQPYTHEATQHDDSAMNDIPSVQTHIDNNTFDVTSPPLTNRPDLQALHGIYPTPPDGLATHGATQLQPHSEILATSNGDPGHAPSFTPSDPVLENSAPLFDGGPDVEGDQPQRNHSIVSSIGPHGQDWNRGSTDDLFGDMDDMEYTREVGDADFNFFDEPDAEPIKDDVGASCRATSDALAEHVAIPDELQNDVAQHHPTEASDAQSLADLPAAEDSTHMDEANHDSPQLSSEYNVDKESAPADQEEQPTMGHYSVKADQFDDDKPLSPFGIKEALLPPPIPASALHGHTNMAAERRRSSFGPLVFNKGSTFAPPSATGNYTDFRPEERRSSYDLGPTRVPLTAISESSVSMDTPSSLDDAESDMNAGIDSEDDSASTTSQYQHAAEDKVMESACFATRKRKRTLDTISYCGPQSTVAQQGSRNHNAVSHNTSNGLPGDQMQDLISKLLKSYDFQDANASQELEFALGTRDSSERRALDIVHSQSDYIARSDQQSSVKPGPVSDPSSASVMHVFPSLKPSDLVVLGQIVAEQAVAICRSIALEFATSGSGIIDESNGQSTTLRALDATLESISLALILAEMPSLALVREPLQIQRPQASQHNASVASQARQPPRPPPRVDPTALGPDILPLTASFIRANRSESSWEMAPTALSFWEALGLSPVSGPKDIRLFCIAPDNISLERPIDQCLRNLKAAYEGCKFGSLALGPDFGDTRGGDFLHPVTFDGSTVPSRVTAMQAYWHSCTNLGTDLAGIAFDEPSRTIIVSMINPFPSATSAESTATSQLFGACCLQFSKSYHNAVSRDQRFNSKGLSKRQVSDIDFQIFPVDLVASSSSLVVPTAHQMGLLARELYDSCPPSSDIANESSPLSNAAAPSVELVAPLPKRIGFQLSADPPADLMHEASVLHLAYATSADGKWTNVVWHDNTGRYTNSSAFCMQARSFAEIALEVWKRTVDLIKAREVIWRIFIVTAGGDGIEASRANCWKDIISQHTERKQLLSVTLLHFQSTLALSITAPLDSQPIQAPGSGAPTPAATPQPGSGQAISITSPEAVGAGNAPVTAPPTPAPSEAASSILEADPDAHLVETEDETWGMLIDRDVASTLHPPRHWPESIAERPDHIAALSHGILIKRGKASNTTSSVDNERPYPCVGASLIWTLRVRPKGDRQGVGERSNVDEGSARHAEVMLREVLGMFRNLGLLSKVKGLDPSGLVPVHVVIAMKGAEGLNGLLRDGGKVDVE